MESPEWIFLQLLFGFLTSFSSNLCHHLFLNRSGNKCICWFQPRHRRDGGRMPLSFFVHEGVGGEMLEDKFRDEMVEFAQATVVLI